MAGNLHFSKMFFLLQHTSLGLIVRTSQTHAHPTTDMAGSQLQPGPHQGYHHGELVKSLLHSAVALVVISTPGVETICFLLGSLYFIADRKVFSKLNFHVPEETVGGIVLCTAGVIEPTLSALREKILSKVENTKEDTVGYHVREFNFQNY